jgi:hypothetical protein
VIGGAVGGIAALAALLLLLFLFKKKKGQVEEIIEETVQSEGETVTELEDYISEYGLSDPLQMGSDEDQEDLPNLGESGDLGESDLEGHSENNPEELEGEFDE